MSKKPKSPAARTKPAKTAAVAPPARVDTPVPASAVARAFIAARNPAAVEAAPEKVKKKAKGQAPKGKKKDSKDKKDGVRIRFEAAQLVDIDRLAAAQGLSRAAWVRLVVSRALAQA